MLPMAGVYEIRNVVNGKRYIGSSVHVAGRIQNHKRGLCYGNHENSYLQRAWNKYGENNFVFKILLYCNRELAVFYEQRSIDVLKPEYNYSPTAGSCLGRKFTEESKAKISAARMGWCPSEETRAKMAASKIGNKSHFGHPHSVETKAQLSAICSNPSDETRVRMSLSHIGKKITEETKAKIGAASLGNKYALGCKGILGQKLSAETKAKISLALTGQKLSAETKKKISESLKRYHGNILSLVSDVRDAASPWIPGT
jgi:group I intron endonuclease